MFGVTVLNEAIGYNYYSSKALEIVSRLGAFLSESFTILSGYKLSKIEFISSIFSPLTSMSNNM